MKQLTQPSLAERFNDRTAVEAAIRKAVREAVLDHARTGHPVATWQDGKVVWLQPAEVFARLAAEPPAGPTA